MSFIMFRSWPELRTIESDKVNDIVLSFGFEIFLDESITRIHLYWTSTWSNTNLKAPLLPGTISNEQLCKYTGQVPLDALIRRSGLRTISTLYNRGQLHCQLWHVFESSHLRLK